MGRAGRLTGSSRRAAVGLATLAMLVPFAAPAGTVAQGSPIVDFCVGVDHPPFERSYPGNGASYVLIAVSVDGAVELLVQLVTPAGPSEQMVNFSGPDRAMVSFPIFAYDTYPWTIGGPGGTTLEQGNLVVGPSEIPCSTDGLAISPSAPPSVTPSAAPSVTPEPASPSPSAAPQTEAPTTAPSPSVAAPSPSGAVVPPDGGQTSGGFSFPWVLLILVGVLLALAGTLVMFLGVDWSGETSCPDECPTLGAKQQCTVSAFGISSQGRTPDNDAGIDLALTLMRYAPLPGMGTGLPSAIGKTVVTGAPPPVPLPATASGAARGPTIDMARELHGFLNNRFPQIWIKVDYQECQTARCFPQVWRTYRRWVSTTSPWTQVREGTPTVANPMGVFPKVEDWAKAGIARAINQAIVDTINAMGCQ